MVESTPTCCIPWAGIGPEMVLEWGGLSDSLWPACTGHLFPCIPWPDQCPSNNGWTKRTCQWSSTSRHAVAQIKNSEHKASPKQIRESDQLASQFYPNFLKGMVCQCTLSVLSCPGQSQTLELKISTILNSFFNYKSLPNKFIRDIFTKIILSILYYQIEIILWKNQ